DLYKLDRWCDANSVNLNTKKCQAIEFHRCHSAVIFVYKVLGEPIARVQDFGVILAPSLSPKSLLPKISCRVNRRLDSISASQQTQLLGCLDLLKLEELEGVQ
ncbi:hypothetical protein J6590_106328, partial [Homalodisca vitripennis]